MINRGILKALLVLTGLIVSLAATTTPVGGETEEPRTSQHPGQIAGIIAGRIIDAEGEPVSDAYLVLCDQATGVPIAAKALRPVTDELLAGARINPMDFLQSWTDPQGRFRFERVPAGRYRLIAQSCPSTQSKDAFFKVMDREIRLRGIAENVVVSKDSSPEVVIRPLGTGVLRIKDNLKGKDGVLVAISTAPTRADPALRFVGWGGAFAQHLIGGGRKLAGRLTVSGLPPGKIYVAACGFCADDMSGWGAAKTTVKPGQTAKLYVPIHSMWAGHLEPPKRLRPLVEKVKSFGPIKFLKLLLWRNGFKVPQDYGDIQAIWRLDRVISRNLDRKVELPTGGVATLADAMAAFQYAGCAKEKEEEKKKK